MAKPNAYESIYENMSEMSCYHKEKATHLFTRRIEDLEKLFYTIPNKEDMSKDLLARITALESQVAALKGNVPEVKPLEWPEGGDGFYFIGSGGSVLYEIFGVDSTDNNNMRSYGNCYRTKDEAYAAMMRIKSMKRPVWKPNEGEIYLYWDLCGSNIHFYPGVHFATWEDSPDDMEMYNLGRVFKTEKEAEEHAKTYAKYWMEIV